MEARIGLAALQGSQAVVDPLRRLAAGKPSGFSISPGCRPQLRQVRSGFCRCPAGLSRFRALLDGVRLEIARCRRETALCGFGLDKLRHGLDKEDDGTYKDRDGVS